MHGDFWHLVLIQFFMLFHKVVLVLLSMVAFSTTFLFVQNIQQPIRIFETSGYWRYHGEQTNCKLQCERAKKTISETGVKVTFHFLGTTYWGNSIYLMSSGLVSMSRSTKRRSWFVRSFWPPSTTWKTLSTTRVGVWSFLKTTATWNTATYWNRSCRLDVADADGENTGMTSCLPFFKLKATIWPLTSHARVSNPVNWFKDFVCQTGLFPNFRNTKTCNKFHCLVSFDWW